MEFANAQAACLYRERLKRERESSTVPMIAKARAMMIASNSSLASRKTERAKSERTSVSVPGIITGKHATTTTTNRSIDRCRQRRRGRSSKHRNLAIEVLSEIRTTGAAQKAAKVLGLSNDVRSFFYRSNSLFDAHVSLEEYTAAPQACFRSFDFMDTRIRSLSRSSLQIIAMNDHN